jgi:hypothetical protein
MQDEEGRYIDGRKSNQGHTSPLKSEGAIGIVENYTIIEGKYQKQGTSYSKF